MYFCQLVVNLLLTVCSLYVLLLIVGLMFVHFSYLSQLFLLFSSKVPPPDEVNWLEHLASLAEYPTSAFLEMDSTFAGQGGQPMVCCSPFPALRLPQTRSASL